MAITKRRREVLDFIENFIKEHRYSPSFEEIMKAMNLKSLATVHKHVTNLEKSGFLKRSHNSSRSIEITDPPFATPRFVFEGLHHLWDRVESCYWVRESDCKK